MTSLQDELNKAIEEQARDFCVNDYRPESAHERDQRHFEAGAQSMMPVIELLIFQRDTYIFYCEHLQRRDDKESTVRENNKEILELIKGDKL